jgi:membrane fusion protein (multidrug efflux system)
MTKRMILMLLLAGVVFGTVFGGKYAGKLMMESYLSKMPVPPATISAGAAQVMSWDNRLEAIGSFVPVNGTEVTTEAGGIVTGIHFESGAQVSKGTLLVTLDSANEAAELKRLQAQAELAELNRSRREKLYQLEAISKADYDAAVSEANAARAAVEAQRAKLAQKNIRAPFAGVLGIRKINVGQFLAPGTAVVSLQALDPIYFDFSLPEQQVAQAQPGLPVKIRVDALPGEEFNGEVQAVEAQIDQATRNFRLRARLDNPGLKLRPGQFGKLQLVLPGERQLLVVPRTAINYNSFGTSVFVVQKKKDAPPPPEKPMPGMPPHTDLEVVQRFVKTGDARGDYVAVIEGLQEGEQVATSGLLKLRNGQPVIINNEMAPKVELDPAPPQG